MAKKMEKITMYHGCDGREFFILRDITDNSFWGIECKYFRNGVLTRQVNGVEGHYNDSFKRVLEQLEHECYIMKCVADGMDFDQALKSMVKKFYGNES